MKGLISLIDAFDELTIKSQSNAKIYKNILSSTIEEKVFTSNQNTQSEEISTSFTKNTLERIINKKKFKLISFF